MEQQDLFGAVLETYIEAGSPVSNADLYQRVADKLQLSAGAREETAPVGRAEQPRNLFHRRVQWIQQDMKEQAVLQRIDRGHWEMIGTKKLQLRAARQGHCVLVMSTRHGLCLWERTETVFREVIDEPIHLMLSSPPYPLKVQRAYGNVALQEYVDFIQLNTFLD